MKRFLILISLLIAALSANATPAFAQSIHQIDMEQAEKQKDPQAPDWERSSFPPVEDTYSQY